MKPYIIISYYTKNSDYEKEAKKLVESLKQFNIPYDVEEIEGFYEWHKNTLYKGEFVKKKMLEHRANYKAVVWIDVDAKVIKEPVLFKDLEGDIACVIIDWSKHIFKRDATEWASGTVYIKTNEAGFKIVDRWIEENNKQTSVFDQRNLQYAVKSLLPIYFKDWREDFTNWELRLPILNCGLDIEHRDFCYTDYPRGTSKDTLDNDAMKIVNEFNPHIIINCTVEPDKSISPKACQEIMAKGIQLFNSIWETYKEDKPFIQTWFDNCNYCGVFDSLSNYFKFRIMAEERNTQTETSQKMALGKRLSLNKKRL